MKKGGKFAKYLFCTFAAVFDADMIYRAVRYSAAFIGHGKAGLIEELFFDTDAFIYLSAALCASLVLLGIFSGTVKKRTTVLASVCLLSAVCTFTVLNFVKVPGIYGVNILVVSMAVYIVSGILSAVFATADSFNMIVKQSKESDNDSTT